MGLIPGLIACGGIRGLIHFLSCILTYFPVAIMKCDPTRNENKFWVPPPSMRPFVIQFYLYVMTVFFRHVSFL